MKGHSENVTFKANSARKEDRVKRGSRLFTTDDAPLQVVEEYGEFDSRRCTLARVELASS